MSPGAPTDSERLRLASQNGKQKRRVPKNTKPIVTKNRKRKKDKNIKKVNTATEAYLYAKINQIPPTRSGAVKVILIELAG
jgi:hypothetical protein